MQVFKEFNPLIACIQNLIDQTQISIQISFDPNRDTTTKGGGVCV